MKSAAMPKLGMPPSRFLRDHWQKRPLLVRGALPAFRDLLSPEELAGLSCEDDVESRLVVRSRKKFEVAYGPHDEDTFRALPDDRWTLLVQEVNRHVPSGASLLDAFSFLPNVRVDDIMVSYAAPGGGVGPHIDSYDVFLVQGSGRRRWRYGAARAKDTSLVAGAPLRLLSRFSPAHDEILEPGDMLYIPPGVAHDGEAVDACMTYSVGFRAPNVAEMLGDLAHALADTPAGAALYEDPGLTPQKNPGLVSPAARGRARAMIRGMHLTDLELDRWYARFATRLKPGHALPRPARAPTWEQISKRLARGATVARTEEGRFAYFPSRAGRVWLFVGGEELDVPPQARALAEHVCATRRFAAADLLSRASVTAARVLLTSLFEMGALYFER